MAIVIIFKDQQISVKYRGRELCIFCEVTSLRGRCCLFFLQMSSIKGDLALCFIMVATVVLHITSPSLLISSSSVVRCCIWIVILVFWYGCSDLPLIMSCMQFIQVAILTYLVNEDILLQYCLNCLNQQQGIEMSPKNTSVIFHSSCRSK